MLTKELVRVFLNNGLLLNGYLVLIIPCGVMPVSLGHLYLITMPSSSSCSGPKKQTGSRALKADRALELACPTSIAKVLISLLETCCNNNQFMLIKYDIQMRLSYNCTLVSCHVCVCVCVFVCLKSCVK